MRRVLYWFRNDLRLHDNLALAKALAESDELVPVYILDDLWLGMDKWGFQRTGPYRLQFLLESLADLKAHLQELGSNLIVIKGNTVEAIDHLFQAYKCSSIVGSKEYTHEEMEMEEAIGQLHPLELYHNSTLIHPDDLPFDIDRMPEVFTAFRKKVERYSEVRPTIGNPESISSPDIKDNPIPTMEELGFEAPKADKRAAIAFKGGALEAWKRLDHYLWKTEGLSTYKETRNGLIGPDYSSKFSAWLANGSISARAIYEEVENYEAEVEKNDSTYWMKFELLWRDFFKYTAMRYGNRIFHSNGIKEQKRKWGYRRKAMDKWINGETGDEFVDANMMELKLTGFMSNRGRQNVASYLVHQLNLDWRAGAAWFESMLVDYDVSSNYGNWIYAAGVGNDPRDRVFNTSKQAKVYDGNGAYRKQWLEDRR